MKRAIGVIMAVGSIATAAWLGGRGAIGTVSTPRTEEHQPMLSESGIGSIQGIGFVEPVSEVRRLVFKADGVIAKCSAEVGRSCKKGDLLMELDGREQLAAASVAEAEWKQAVAERNKVESGVNPHQIAAAEHKVESLKEQVRYRIQEHARYSTLAPRGAASAAETAKCATEMNQSQIELRQAEADLRHLRHYVREEDRNLAEAKVGAARAKLDLARQQVEDTILRAPFDGTVLEVLKREGEGARLLDQEPVAIFGDASRLRIRAEVDERFVARLKAGQEAMVFGRGLGDKRYPGRVTLIKPIMGKKTVFSRSATERKDLDVLQVMIEIPEAFVAPVGLEVDVKIKVDERSR